MSYSTTKTTYRLAKRRKPDGRFVFWLLVFLVLLIGGGAVRFIFSKPLVFVTLPAREAFTDTARDIGGFGYWFTSNQKLILENTQLKELVGRTRTLEAQLEMLKQEKSDLLEAAARRPTGTKTTVARVITAPDQSPYDTLLLDVGRDNTTISLATSSLVTDVDGVLLGRLEEIGGQWSRALLFSTPGQSLPVIVGTTTIRAIARGAGAGNFIIDVPRGTPVPLGAVVQSGNIHRRLVGIVEKITVDPAKTSDRLLVRTPVNIFMLRQVLVYDATP